MYYYIMEQPKNRAMQSKQEYIRGIISNLGIIGEVVTVSPARTTEELVDMGVTKSYSTIVAVGSDRHINRIASLLKHKKPALGIIPLNCSELVSGLIGTNDIKEACNILKSRRLKEASLGLVEPNKYFITQAEIHSPKSEFASFTIINPGSDSYIAECSFTEIIISKNLYTFITDRLYNQNLIKNTWNWLVGKKNSDIVSSILRGKKIKIETENPVPVMLDNEIVAKTPIVVSYVPKALKIITKPARIVEEEKKEK